MSELTILVPVLNRPDNVEPLLESIEKATPAGCWEALFICDRGDEAEKDAVINAMHSFGTRRVDYLTVSEAGYAAKINAGLVYVLADFYFLAADDLDFKPGWFEAAKALMVDGIGVVGTNDLGNPRVIAGEHATHSLVTREYAERGTIDGGDGLLHEGYHHWKLDDELVATAKHRGAWAFAGDSVVEHLHPYWDKGEMDDTYRKGEKNARKDRALFAERSQLWS